MKREIYQQPHIQIIEVQGEIVMQSVSAGNEGIRNGGNASEFNIQEADANQNQSWDMW